MSRNVGIVVISHEQIAEQMLQVVKKIVRGVRPMHHVSMALDESSRLWKEKLKQAIATADQGRGVLLLADVYGATPFNVCQNFVEPGKVALVAGFNLPMLLKLAAADNGYKAPETLADYIRDYGQRHITLAEEPE